MLTSSSHDPAEPSAAQAGPLAGLRVLELGTTVAGPFCGRLFADFGAEVIKVEPLEGDPVRTMGKRHDGHSLYAASILRNKELIAVDLRRPEGQAIVRRIAASCDVVIENFRPGTLEKWGLDEEALSEDNPGLIFVRISGYGQTGPYRDRAGYGVIGEALSGLRHVTGDPDRPPTRSAVSLTDCVTGLYAAFGALIALRERDRSGRGQVVDAALYESAFSLMEPHVPAFDKLGFVANRTGSALPDSVPNNLYLTREGSFVHITAMGDAVFARLAAAIGQPSLATDARFARAGERSKHADQLDTLIANWTRNHELAEIEACLLAASVPATRIYTMADIFDDPQYAAREMLVPLHDDDLGNVTVAGVVPKLSATPGRLRRAGGKSGRDTYSVLARLARLEGNEINRLLEAGVIRGPRPTPAQAPK